ncbi:glycosyltransferase family 9 protein [Synechococcus sp. CS-1332]|uniref:glycosyltransferase family 9 protein n=1 Tax=Synechococcus sp. CS-1332 TaxID=2847972 RepID=UPI00223B7919|nr:lipopolysaccharide heptosyltransferase family protein [Synechococcus sp. CS-1332]MCT0207028.1 lipopolysaccharide heptosyltransferase family protein [Synechococcus sp. CS-1332]
MRALFLIPGDGASQLQALPAVAATAEQLHFQIQVACHPSLVGLWKLLPAVEKVLPFNFGDATLADWANLLGCVREPDFQACINLASGRQVDLMLSMSHIPNRMAAGGFSATETVQVPQGLWPAQALEAYLRPIGVNLDAAAFRLSLSKGALDEAGAALPAGDGPMLLLAPSGSPDDWPAAAWQELPGRIAATLPGLRSLQVTPASSAHLPARAALVATSDVVLANDPVTIELALLSGTPVVALGRSSDSLPVRSGVQGLGSPGHLRDLPSNDVLRALGLG